MARRFRFVALAALLLASALALSACGGGDKGGGDTSAAGLLKSTFSSGHSIKSGKLSVELGFDAKGLSTVKGPLAIKLSGPFESQGKGQLPKLDLALAFASGGTNITAGLVSTGDRAYVRLQGQPFVVDDATFQKFKQGYEKSAANSTTGSPTFSSLGIDPLRWLKDPKVAGTETVGGDDTYHITAGVDVNAAVDDIATLLAKAGSLGQGRIPTTITAQQRRDIASSVRSASLEVWTGKSDHALRRVRLDVAIAVPASVRPRAGGMSSGRLLFDLTIAELNKTQTINAPANARPLSELQSLLGGGAASGAGTTTPPAATTTTPAPSVTTTPATTPQSSSKYLTCLQKAGGDVAKVQQCAALAGQ